MNRKAEEERLAAEEAERKRRLEEGEEVSEAEEGTKFIYLLS